MPRSWLSQGEMDLRSGDEWLTEAEAARLARMRYPKRREESRLGRWTAKRALAAVLGHPSTDSQLARLEVRNAADGAPEPFRDGRPLDLSISMTDRAGWAVTVVGERGVSIGCDLELVEPRSAAFVRDYFTPAEQAVVAAEGGAGHDLAANLIWSAKESALKVLRTGLRRDTRSVEVELDFGVDAGWAPLVVRPEEGGAFPGWWRRYGEFLLTVAATAAYPPPVPLEEPPGLAGAAPVHSWLPG